MRCGGSIAQILRQCEVVLLGLSCALAARAVAEEHEEIAVPDCFDVRRFGAVTDGKTDDIAAFPRALDAAGKAT